MFFKKGFQMSANYHYLREQKEVIASMGQSLLHSFAPFLKKGKQVPALPSEVQKCQIPPRNNHLIDDYISHVGGSIDAYRLIVPWHFYPQWAVPMVAKLYQNIPFNMTRTLNAGCSVIINHQIPRDADLFVKSRLKEIVNDERKILLVAEISTDTKEHRDALIVEQKIIIPKRGPSAKKSKKNHIPYHADKIGTLKIPKRSGLDFALLTGDFNPIHWIPLYAKAMGFESTIAHGFSTMARTMELINFEVFEGDVDRVKSIDIRFTRPLRFPANVDVFIDKNKFFVGHGPGGQAFLMGTYAQTEENS